MRIAATGRTGQVVQSLFARAEATGVTVVPVGRPELDLLTILVREAAQNSWDARLPSSSDPVDFRIDIRTVGPAHSGAWRELLIENAPDSVEQFPLRDTLRHGPIRLLSVSDRGTRGLGGPTRADSAVGKSRDFVSFIRNIGEPRDTALGGGTYGFGKGIFWGNALVYQQLSCTFNNVTNLAEWANHCARSGGAGNGRG